MTTTKFSDLQTTAMDQVEKIVASGEDIRRQLTKVISETACRSQESGEGFVELIQSVIEGARAGLEKSFPKDCDDVVRQVVDALGDGLSQTALAARLTVEEAVSSSRRYTEKDLNRLRDDLNAVRDLFVETVATSLKASKALTESQIASAKTHANRVVDRRGPVFNEVFEVVRKNPAAFARESIQAGVSAGQGAAVSLCEALSRSLKRAAEELDRVGKQKKVISSKKPRIGLALGSGSARGWAHIGVIRAMQEAGIHPDIVVGTSIGALIGTAYAAGELDNFEQWVLQLKVTDVLGFMDVGLQGGLVKGERLMDFFRHRFVDRPIEELPIPFAAVATALHNGAEIWLRSGSTLSAVRASIAMPGLFEPVLRDGAVLVDGGLVNPVPVSLARAMGADFVVAVDLGSDILGRHLRTNPAGVGQPGVLGAVRRKVQEKLGIETPWKAIEEPAMPSIAEVLASSLNIMQVRIGRSRLAGDPPDVIIAPRLAHLRLLDFHRAKEAIEEGRHSVERVAQCLTLLAPNVESAPEPCPGLESS